MQFTKEQIGVDVSAAELVEFLNDRRRGGFAYVHGYVSEGTGEVANHWFKGACLYPNMVARSVEAIDDGSLRGRLIEGGLEVHRGTWVAPDGSRSPRKAKGRTYQHIAKTYSMADVDDAAVVLAAIASVRDGLVNPRKVDQGFTAVANGTYVKADEAPGVVYFRDCMAVSKFVVKQGEFPQTASDELPAVKEAIRRLLPVGKYRAYKLCGNFEYVSIDGQALLQGANLGKWDMALALKEDVKEVVPSYVLGQVVKEMTGE